jgi:hypothetical protein
MKKLFLFTLFVTLFVSKSYSQSADRISFAYDFAGNQSARTLCISCLTSRVNNNNDNSAKAQEEKLQKFFPEDVLSYYPNPVKEELYLKWELVNNIKVTTIDLYSVSGQLIKQINEFNTANTHIISFNELAVGMYLLNLNYSNGEVKTINIAKQ